MLCSVRHQVSQNNMGDPALHWGLNHSRLTFGDVVPWCALQLEAERKRTSLAGVKTGRNRSCAGCKVAESKGPQEERRSARDWRPAGHDWPIVPGI